MDSLIYCESAWLAWLAAPGVAVGEGDPASPDERGGGEPAASLERLLMAIVAMLERSFPEAFLRTRELIGDMLPGRPT